MKNIYVFLLMIPFSVSANYVNTYLLDLEESDKNENQSKAGVKTKDALLSIDAVEERADYLVFKLKNLTFGEYSEDVMLIAPLVTGELEFSANEFKVYYNHFQNRGGVKYKYTF